LLNNVFRLYSYWKKSKLLTKKIILANHTPWILEILLNSKEYIKDRVDLNLVWKGFMEHPQLSYWILIDKKYWNLVRDIPTTQLYNDTNVWNLNYRIEYHTAPPEINKIKRYVNNKEWILDFQKHFIRLWILIEQKSSINSSLNFNNWTFEANDFFKKEIINLTEKVKEDLIKKISKLNWVRLLNKNSNIWYSWHLMWWLQFLSNDKPYKIWKLKNTYIASSAIFKVGWLFNPTFTIFFISDLIVKDILKDFNI